jgi:hypothetical protein
VFTGKGIVFISAAEQRDIISNAVKCRNLGSLSHPVIREKCDDNANRFSKTNT